VAWRGQVGDSGGVLPRLLQHLRKRYRPHAILLYGSRARGAGNAESDWDLLLLRKSGRVRDVRDFEGLALDVFVESDAIARRPATADLLRLRGARVLLDERGDARRLLRRVEALAKRGPPKLIKGEAAALRAWAWKMVARAKSGGAYADYRRAALLTELLPLSYELRRRFFPGPKRALAELPAPLRKRWATALKPGAPMRAVEQLVRAVVGAPR